MESLPEYVKAKKLSKTDENPDDDEDDSWLDELDLQVDVQVFLDVFSSIDLLSPSQCLAAALSEKLEEPTGDTITESSQPKSQEALGELFMLDDDFSMHLS